MRPIDHIYNATVGIALGAISVQLYRTDPLGTLVTAAVVGVMLWRCPSERRRA